MMQHQLVRDVKFIDNLLFSPKMRHIRESGAVGKFSTGKKFQQVVDRWGKLRLKERKTVNLVTITLGSNYIKII